MRNRSMAMVILLLAIVVAAFWALRPDVTSPETTRASKPGSASPAQPSATAAAAAAPAAKPDDVASEPVTSAAPSDSASGKTNAKQPFRVDSTGKLVIDEQTRLNMEAFFAETDRNALVEAQQSATENLPAPAAMDAQELLERYDNYSKAQRQSYPPGIAPATEEAALAELDGLHALRVAHFGPETAKALFGAEEYLTRSLIELMRLEKDQSLTLPEKAERAQKLHDEIASRQKSQP